LWDLESGTRKATLGQIGEATGVAFLPGGGKLLAAAGGIVKRWDVVTGREEASLEWHQGGISSLALSPDGKWLATSGSEGIRLWPVGVIAGVAEGEAGHGRG
jgi:WD40 repeat protein